MGCELECAMGHLAHVCVRVSAENFGACLRDTRYRRDPRLKRNRAQLLPHDGTTLRKTALFSGVDEGVINRLAAQGRVRAFYRGEALHHQGDPASAVSVVLEGIMKICRTTADGTMTVRRIVGPGESFAEAAFCQSHYPASAEAITDLRVLDLPVRLLTDTMTDHPALAVALVQALAGRVEHQSIELERAYRASGTQRLAGYLAELFNPDDQHVDLRLPYDKNVLAARLGVTPESLSRSFLTLRDYGVRTHNRCVYVEDVARLRQYADLEDV